MKNKQELNLLRLNQHTRSPQDRSSALPVAALHQLAAGTVAGEQLFRTGDSSVHH